MNISEHLRRAADDADPQGLDLDHLAHVARAAGARSHRRRRGAAVLTAAALVGNIEGSDTPMGPNLPTTEANMTNALGSNLEFWVDRDAELNERFNSWLAS